MRDDDDFLEAYFDAAEQTAPTADDALMARVMADAATAAKRPVPAGPARSWRDVWRALGGWPAFGGLATAALAGVWIGAAQPLGFAPLDGAWTASTIIDEGDLDMGYDTSTWSDG